MSHLGGELSRRIAALALGRAPLGGRDDEPSDAIASALVQARAANLPSLGNELTSAASAVIAAENAQAASELVAGITRAGRHLGAEALGALHLLREWHPDDGPWVLQVAKAWIECAPETRGLPFLLSLPLADTALDGLTALWVRRRQPERFLDYLLRLEGLSEEAVLNSLRLYLAEDPHGDRRRGFRSWLLTASLPDQRLRRAAGRAARELCLRWAAPQAPAKTMPRFGSAAPEAAE